MNAMRWFRTNVRFGSRLALLALAVQIALSFVHAHFGNVGRGSVGLMLAAKSSQALTAPNAPEQPALHLRLEFDIRRHRNHGPGLCLNRLFGLKSNYSERKRRLM